MRIRDRSTSLARRLPTLLLVALTAACSQGEKPATQIAVKVNDGELSIHQVNAQLGRLQNVPPERHDAVRKQVVDALIDQQLLLQQSIEAKLDRDPEVLASIEQSRTQILAQAYVRKTLGAQARPSDEEIRQYYADNPELFSSRRVFRIEELGTDLPVERADELRRVTAAARNLADVAQWLQKNQFKVSANVAVRGAEQLPLQHLKAIGAMKDGQMQVFENQGQVVVVHLLASQSQPVSDTQAQPAIEQFLANRKRDELARAELKRLRDSAKIEYVGEFTKLAALDGTKAGGAAAEAARGTITNAAPSATADAAAPAQAGAGAGTASPAAPSESVDKGLAGLR